MRFCVVTQGDFRAALGRLCLDQVEAAYLLGVSKATVQRWWQGISEVPGPVGRLLWAMERDDTLPGALQVLADTAPPTPRPRAE